MQHPLGVKQWVGNKGIYYLRMHMSSPLKPVQVSGGRSMARKRCVIYDSNLNRASQKREQYKMNPNSLPKKPKGYSWTFSSIAVK